MLTSKEVMARTGISRATLNNYISLGILPRPEVGPPTSSDPQARRIGYFDDSVVDRILRVQQLKTQGMKMSEIAVEMAIAPEGARDDDKSAEQTIAEPTSATSVPTPVQRPWVAGDPLALTIENLPYPAYMVTSNFQVQWWNAHAADDLFGRTALEGEIEARDIFSLLMDSPKLERQALRRDLLSFHMSIAKRRFERTQFVDNLAGGDRAHALLLRALYDEVEEAASRHILRHAGALPVGEVDRPVNIYASFFREGILFAYVPREDSDNLLDFLSRRERVIRDLLKQRPPLLTDLSVLAASFRNEARLQDELAPRDFFALINDIWGQMDPVFRKYYGTHGKHHSNGLVYYFFPQPDSSHALNAVRCAHDMRELVERIERQWRRRVSWLPDLELGIGVDQGREWFGNVQSAAYVEFSALGDTAGRAERISNMARPGSILVSKALIGEIPRNQTDSLHYGITRRDTRDNTFFIANSFARLGDLVDADEMLRDPHADLAEFAVCEIAEVDHDHTDDAGAPSPRASTEA